jgi:hypothetical protein
MLSARRADRSAQGGRSPPPPYLYLAARLVVPTWNAAFIDTAGAQGILDILQFANSHARIPVPIGCWTTRWSGFTRGSRSPAGFKAGSGGALRAARRVHSLFIDVNELTDKTEKR